MSQYDYDRARRAAAAGKALPDKNGKHWKAAQDSAAGHAAGKNRPG